MLLPAAVSCAVRGVVAGPPRPARVLGVFPSAVYLAVGPKVGTRHQADDPQLVAIVTRDALRLPCSAVVAVDAAERPFADVRAGDLAEVGAGHVILRGLPRRGARAVRWWEPPRPRPATDDSGAASDPADLDGRLRLLSALCPGLRTGGDRPMLLDDGERLAGALATDDHRGALSAADSLIGRGPGLTPSGDDVIAGILLAMTALCPPGAGSGNTDPVRRVGARIAARATGRTTTLSAALLRHAAAGTAAPQLVALVEALAGRGDLAPATRRLAAVGHTSGLDLLLGAQFGGRAVHIRNAPRSPRGESAPDVVSEVA